MHLLIGVPEMFHVGPRYATQSWTAIYGWLPDGFDWLWSAGFVVAGVLATTGIYSYRCMLWSFRLSAALFSLWGGASVYLWVVEDRVGTIPGTSVVLLAGGTFAILGHYVLAEARVRTKIAKIADVVEEPRLERALSEQDRAEDTPPHG